MAQSGWKAIFLLALLLIVAGPTQAQITTYYTMKYLSLAMHAMQDATSPAHAKFRPYYGGNMELGLHMFEELFDPKEGSNLDRATDLAYKYYTGELPMPRDFFENLCTDHGTDHYYRTHPR